MSSPTEPLLHRGAGTLEAPELLLRQVLIEGLVLLAGDEYRLNQLLGRVDDLRNNSAEEWREDLRNALLRMVTDPNRPGSLRVGIGYPQTEPLPYVSIVAESGAESPAAAVAGDVLTRKGELRGDASLVHITRGVGYLSQLQIGSWSTVAEESVLLNAVVRSVLLDAKGRLVEAGAHEIGLSDSGFEPSADLYPQTGYVPVLRCSIEWTLRTTRRIGPRPASFRIRTVTYGN